ncbi:myosin C [Toxoplasma gondii GT1]|uniref:Myosin-B/C n=15 Tax=Apicomplexa TaxID=5794 RepID=MYOB_TOXGO|nr:RecName: Full=Myosin-B/C; Short=MyoB/C; AltName: Full=TgM-B [Toxoplasma gondii]EPR64013.1 myosin C [Toxoplasma gondii GT1]KFG36958.1 myosin C [Toxoplasma gondii FOU]KFG50597.1 myosin C [Toxoplasma gondii p89]KFH02952.1 myosin C [Toxoplasma gondii VAND]PUA85760.1 myosin C [Toxoplasma gondii TgCATBr9]RQX68186.1 myosin C [Toxoplasma gondii CAST]
MERKQTQMILGRRLAKDSPEVKHFQRKSSVVPFGRDGRAATNFTCWTADCPAVKADPTLVFAKCIVVGGSMDTQLELEQVDPPARGTFTVAPTDVFNANELIEPETVDDIGYLPHTNVACVLDVLKSRFLRSIIYTTAEPLLVAINPFKDLGNTTDAWISTYRNASKPEMLPPHVFKTARAALEDLEGYKKNQSIIVSGESGAGKTEATKQIMRFFASASSEVRTTIQDTIMAGNPILEAFGNAKTIRNNNSSRFGRFMMLDVSSHRGIQHGSISNFLLEKVRVVSQEANERSYHIFYQLLKGATSEMRAKYHLRSLKEYAYLNGKNGGCYDVPGIDDKADFEEVLQSLDAMQITGSKRHSVFSILSGLLLIGNVSIEGKDAQGVPDAAYISPQSEEILEEACQLLSVDDAALKKEILVKSTKVGPQVIEGVRTKDEAKTSVLSLSKNVYDKLFDWLVRQLNSLIDAPDGMPNFIGILDIFGFEVLEVNSLEQVLINITNEYLQKHFIDVVFDMETKLYQAEGVPTEALEYTDNLALVGALCGKNDSFFALLEDACLGIRSTDEGFCGTILRRLEPSGFFLESRRDKRLKFIIRHTIADIEYTCEGMLEKNKDFLRKEVMDVMKASTDPVTKALFEGIEIEAGKIGKGTLIASRFLKNLEEMIGIVAQTEAHFIRCLKPNEEKKPLGWNGSKVLNQLFSLSILEALQLRQVGYAYRRNFSEFCSHFRWLDLGLVNSDRDRKEVAQLLLEQSGIPESSWVIGKTMVFVKPDAAKELSILQREKLMCFQPLIAVLGPMWRKVLLRKKMARVIHFLTRLESNARRHLEPDSINISPEEREALLSGMERPRNPCVVVKKRVEPERAPPTKVLSLSRARLSLSKELPRNYAASNEALDVDDTMSVDTDAFLRLKMKRSPNENYLRQTALARLKERRPSHVCMEEAYHVWRSVELLFREPLSDKRLQNICTVIRNDMDQHYGFFWQVIINRTPNFGMAATHIHGSLHVVEQEGMYRDGRQFLFHLIMYKTRKPRKEEIRLHERAAEKTYGICRKRDFSGIVRVMNSKVPPYMQKDVSYLIGMLFQRYQYTRDWTNFATCIQSYLIGRYSEPFGGAWNVVAQEGAFFLSRLWTKHSRFLRVEIDFPALAEQASSEPCPGCPTPVLTVVCFEACAPDRP